MSKKKNKDIENVPEKEIPESEEQKEFTEKKETVKEKVKNWTANHKSGIKHTAITAAATVAGGVAGFIGGIAFERSHTEDEDPMAGVEDLIDTTPEVPEAETEVE